MALLASLGYVNLQFGHSDVDCEDRMGIQFGYFGLEELSHVVALEEYSTGLSCPVSLVEALGIELKGLASSIMPRD